LRRDQQNSGRYCAAMRAFKHRLSVQSVQERKSIDHRCVMRVRAQPCLAKRFRAICDEQRQDVEAPNVKKRRENRDAFVVAVSVIRV
jgi:hypothetical protein